jgi:hypothetical protein
MELTTKVLTRGGSKGCQWPAGRVAHAVIAPVENDKFPMLFDVPATQRAASASYPQSGAG